MDFDRRNLWDRIYEAFFISNAVRVVGMLLVLALFLVCWLLRVLVGAA